MIKSFKTQGTRDIFNGKPSIEARKTCPSILWGVAARKLDMINAAITLNDLKVPPGNRLEKLKGDREGQYSIRINARYRICFAWITEPENVELIDYHL